MPERRRSSAPAQVALPPPRSAPGWAPARAGEVVAPPEVLAAGLLTWADQDDGFLALLDVSRDGRPQVQWVNRAGADLLGYAADELRGQSLERLLRSPFSIAHEGTGELPLVHERRVVRRAMPVQRFDGSVLRVTLTTVPVAGSRQGWVLRLVPEHDVEAIAAGLLVSHERFRALADKAPIAIFSSDSGVRLSYVNDVFAEVCSESPERLVGTGWLSSVHAADRPQVLDAMTAVLSGIPQELPLRVVRPDGEVRSLRARVVPVSSARRDAGFVGTLEDVTERQEWEATLAYQASHDPLTGLLNRRRLLELLGEQLALPSRDDDQPALLFLDLDDFKQINDSLGHDAGDRLLLEVAERLRQAVREGDVVSRFGGDEFAVLCHGVLDEEAASDVARRLLAAVTLPVILGSRPVHVSGSLGVVLAGPAYVDPEDVLRDADVAMYQAKAAGKDCWALFDEPARLRARDRVELAHDLREAVETGQLSVHYQPVVALEPGSQARPRLVSVEALARWAHPERGMVPPGDFIELAEETGLVVALGLQVLRAACRQMVRWQSSLGALAPSSVSVNVSAVQMRQTDLPEIVAEVLRETGLPGSALTLELTETVVMSDTVTAAASFQRLHAMGVRIAIDDFGTGYSSLSVLRTLPFDLLKIDRSLLSGLTEGTDDPIVAAVVALGTALDLDVVAEGVETPEQVQELRRLGCPLAQGFLFARPMAPEALEGWAVAFAPVSELAS